jgi:hypothetical protein
MLEALKNATFKDMLEHASKSQTGSNIRPLRSLDQLAQTALGLTQNVVDAQCKRDRLSDAYKHEREVAMAYLEKLDSEFEREITAADVALHQAEMKRREAQWRLIRQQIESGVFEGVSDLRDLARTKEFSE